MGGNWGCGGAVCRVGGLIRGGLRVGLCSIGWLVGC